MEALLLTATLDWRVEFPRRPGLHAVRSLSTFYDPMHDTYSFAVRWWDDSYWGGLGWGVRWMYEDTLFDLQSVLDEWHKKILDGPWCDWQWLDLPA